MKPQINPNGVYCPDQWEDNIIIGVDNYKKPHCNISIVKLDKNKWIGSTTFSTATMKCGLYGGGSYPGESDIIFTTKEECIRHHAKYLYEVFTTQKLSSGWNGFDNIIDKLEDIAKLKKELQLTLFNL